MVTCKASKHFHDFFPKYPQGRGMFSADDLFTTRIALCIYNISQNNKGWHVLDSALSFGNFISSSLILLLPSRIYYFSCSFQLDRSVRFRKRKILVAGYGCLMGIIYWRINWSWFNLRSYIEVLGLCRFHLLGHWIKCLHSLLAVSWWNFTRITTVSQTFCYS